MLTPSEDDPADDAFYQGEVTRIVPRTHVPFGVPVWRVEVIVARPGDQDFVLSLYVPELRFQAGWRPEIGDYVRRSAWVQGYLTADGALL